jgi:cytoskeleton protein RodZ
MMQSGIEPQPNTPVGVLLRNCRLRAGLDLGEMSHSLHIRRCFLEAIETGRFETLPGPVYALGFVRSYAEQLGLDAEEIARRFKREIADHSATPLRFPLPIAEDGTPKGAVLLLGAMITIGAYAAWYFTSSPRIEMARVVAPVPDRLERMLDHRDAVEPATSSQPAAADRTLSSAGPERETEIMPPLVPGAPSPTLDVPAPTRPLPAATPSASLSTSVVHQEDSTPSSERIAGVETASPAVGQAGGKALAAEPPSQTASATEETGRIILKAKAESWVEVRDPARNAKLLARLLKTGDVYIIPGKPGLELLTGNAGGLVVTVDGEVAPPLGKDGVVRRGIALEPEALRTATAGSSMR